MGNSLFYQKNQAEAKLRLLLDSGDLDFNPHHNPDDVKNISHGGSVVCSIAYIFDVVKRIDFMSLRDTNFFHY